MPFDSSKIEFHDKMDMFLKLAKRHRPPEDEEHAKRVAMARKKGKAAKGDKDDGQSKKELT